MVGCGQARRGGLLHALGRVRARLALNSARTAELEARTAREAAELQLGQLVGLDGQGSRSA